MNGSAASAMKKTDVSNPAAESETWNSWLSGAAAGPTTPAEKPKLIPRTMTPTPTRPIRGCAAASATARR
jgi:hypothetical protein